MRALSLREPRQAAILEEADPSPGEGEVLARIRACGICGSDLNSWRGVPGLEYPLPSGAPGHEPYGDVIGVGSGDRLAVVGFGYLAALIVQLLPGGGYRMDRSAAT
jgi:D-arabinose 1-dehydrogenase-like Zn-dependent alcohol dehydrogenase